MVTYKEIDYKNYGKCLEISNGIIDVIATLDVGPRIIRYGFCGKENMFFEDLNREHNYKENDMRYLYGEDKTWYLYGGHRLWISPEYPETYYPDNNKVEYEKIENGVVLLTDVQEITGLKLTLMVEFVGGTELRVSHFVDNESGESQDFSLWALTVLAKGGTEILKMNDTDTELLPNRIMRFWPYTKLQDQRAYFGNKFISLTQDPSNNDKFKVGLDLEYGKALYVNYGVMFEKTYTHYLDTMYPDDGCSFETFTCNNFLECETLGEFGPKPDGSTVCHVENWRLFENCSVSNPKDEVELERLWNISMN